MKRPKTYPIQIWFLDADLQKSAEYMTNKALVASADGCFHALVSARLYFIGIRTKTFYKHYFSKDMWPETKDRFFPLWPLKNKPTFMSYTSKASKWCRMCLEHYEYVKKYLDALLSEYEFRFGKQHGLTKFLEWEEVDAPKLSIPNGNIKKICLPWKCLDPRWRRKDIIEGYRLQFMSSFEDDDAFKAYNGSRRDMPDFVVKHFKLDVAGIE